MSFQLDIKAELKQSSAVLDAFISDQDQLKHVEEAARIMGASLSSGGKILSCGNGGSHCDAMHFAEELTGRYRESRKPLPAIAISDPGYLTCTANDFGFDYVFSRFIEGVGNAGDILFAISTSGNSTNVINAILEAQKKGMQVIGLTGNDGGKMAGICDVEIRVPHAGYADRIQEVHIKVIHILIYLIEKQVS
jgi:D-sedoheptulose 7-phosphate isomerase